MTYEPEGIRFFDNISKREMILVAEGESFAGWLCYRHPDGQWVSLRKATDDDRQRIEDAEKSPMAVVYLKDGPVYLKNIGGGSFRYCCPICKQPLKDGLECPEHFPL